MASEVTPDGFPGFTKLHDLKSRRATVAAVLSAGVKIKGGGVLQNCRFFIKHSRASGEPGEPPHLRVREIHPDFEDFNFGGHEDGLARAILLRLFTVRNAPAEELPSPDCGARMPDRINLVLDRLLSLKKIERDTKSESKQPPSQRRALYTLGPEIGQASINGFLPAAHEPDVMWQNRATQKLGHMEGFKFKRAAGTDPGGAPGGAPECKGDGKKARRWMRGEKGQPFDWHDIVCDPKTCPFGDVCKPVTRLLFRPLNLGSGVLLRYESHGIETAENFRGFFDRLKIEADAMGWPTPNLHGLPIHLWVGPNVKGASQSTYGIHKLSFGPRRFPVAAIDSPMSLAEFFVGRHNELAAIAAGDVAQPLALPPPPVTTPEEEVDSIADFDPGFPSRGEPDDVIEAEEVVEPEEPPKAARAEGPSEGKPADKTYDPKVAAKGIREEAEKGGVSWTSAASAIGLEGVDLSTIKRPDAVKLLRAVRAAAKKKDKQC